LATAKNNYALRHALHGRPNVVKFLVTPPHVDPTAKNNFAIRYAAKYGHIDVVKFLASLLKVKIIKSFFFKLIVKV
jgi:hypothetical protein